MKTQKLNLLFLIATASLIQSCATQTDKAIESKVAAEPAVLKRSDLIAKGENLIEKSPSLSEEQRSALRILWRNSETKMTDLGQASLKLRAVLIENITSSNYDEKEVTLVKQKLANVEQERLSIFLRGVYDTNHILGRWGSANERNNFYQWFTVDPGSHIF